MKIWAKIMTDGKIIRDVIYNSNRPLTLKNYEGWLNDICQLLDLSTPITLPTHFRNFVNFHNTKFKASDFVESFDFDLFIVENCKV